MDNGWFHTINTTFESAYPMISEFKKIDCEFISDVSHEVTKNHRVSE